MNKIQNKTKYSLILGLGASAVLAAAIMIMPIQAQAYVISPYSSYGSVYSNNQYGGYTTKTYSGSQGTYNQQPSNNAANSQTNTPPPTNPQDNSNLGANAIGSSFIPTGIVAWVMIAIMILLIVILARKAFGLDKKYHE